MNESKPTPSSTADREMIHTRVVDAPRELVWEAFTDPKHVAQWWGPNGFTNTIHEMNVRPGGVWRLTMHGPDGTDYPNQMDFIEVVRPERLVYNHGTGVKNDPDAFHVTVTFTPRGDKTEVTLKAVFPTAAYLKRVVEEFGALEGGRQTLAKLAEHVKKMVAPQATAEEFVISRTFNAPRDLVFKAWTEEERLMQWWGPKGFTMLSAKIDLRPGGAFLYGMQAPNGGGEMWGKWVFREIVRPERLVFVSSFSNAKGEIIKAPFDMDWPLETLSTLTFTESGGKTTVTMRGLPINATAAQNATFKSMFPSMQQGWGGTLDQLANYLANA